MSGYGKINLLGMVLMPAIATLAGIVMFGPRVDTMVAVFGMNAIPMLIGGLFSGLLLRGAAKAGGVGRWIALWPSVTLGRVSHRFGYSLLDRYGSLVVSSRTTSRTSLRAVSTMARLCWCLRTSWKLRS